MFSVHDAISHDLKFYGIGNGSSTNSWNEVFVGDFLFKIKKNSYFIYLFIICFLIYMIFLIIFIDYD